MPEPIDHVAFLSQQIGPRPAGTEEEQQAALYITEHLQKEAGLSAVIEDFNSASGYEAARVLCCAVMILFTALALVFPVLAFPSMVIAILAAALFLLEVFDRPVLSRLFPKGVSQNVVAKYEPGYSPDGTGSRRRKIVVVARYDSGKVQPELNGPLASVLPILHFVVLGAVIFVPVLSVVRNVFFLHAVGPVAVVLNVLTVIALILVTLPIIAAVMRKTADYNEGANCNAAGVAVLMDVATRVGRGRSDSDSDADNIDVAGTSFGEGSFMPTIHGEGEARAAGIVPDGTELAYDLHSSRLSNGTAAQPQDPSSRLAAAKAALSAFSGKPVNGAANPDSIDWSSDAAASSFDSDPLSGSASSGGQWPSEASALRSEGFGRFDGSDAAIAGSVETGEGFPRGLSGMKVDDHGFGHGDDSDWFGESQGGTSRNAGASADGFDFAVEGGSALGTAVSGAMGAAAGMAVDAASVGAAVGAAGALAGDRVGSGSASGVPEWFKKAQKKAKKPKDDSVVVQRSRYADALDAAQAGATSPSDAQRATLETEQRLQNVRESIMNAKVPAFACNDEEPKGAFEGLSNSEKAGASEGDTHGDDDFSFDDATCALPPINVNDLRAEGLSSAGATGQSSPSFPPAASVSEVSPADTSDDLKSQGALADRKPSLSAVPEVKRQPSKRRSIALPDIGSAAPALVLPELQKQRAPLADIESAGKGAAKSLLSMLPSIDVSGSVFAQEIRGGGQGNAGATAAEQLSAAQQSPDRAFASPESFDTPSPAKKTTATSLKDSLPSLSGASPAAIPEAASPDCAPYSGQVNPHMQGASVIGATGTFAPVGQELLKGADPSDLYIDDADDSDYEEYVTETGAFAGPGYMEMPKSRMQRLFSKFSFGKKKQEESTPQQWLDVDDSFDARSVGAARGGWESFRSEDDGLAPSSDDSPAPVSADLAASPFDAGASSGFDPASSGAGFGSQTYSEESSSMWDGVSEAWDDSDSDWGASAWNDSAWGDSKWDDSASNESRKTSGSKWYGGAFSRRMMRQTDDDGREKVSRTAGRGFSKAVDLSNEGFAPEEGVADEWEQIHRFHHSSIDTEVWFVALGSELAHNGGMRAFLAEHAQDLRGSIIIELDALGAGDLSLIESEGVYLPVSVSSRMKRYVKKASQAMGLHVPLSSLKLPEGAAAFAAKQGYQAMHLAGLEGKLPAHYAQDDDVLENIDSEKLSQNSAFVMELLRNI